MTDDRLREAALAVVPRTAAGMEMLRLLRDNAPWFLTGSPGGEAAAIIAIEDEASHENCVHVAGGHAYWCRIPSDTHPGPCDDMGQVFAALAADPRPAAHDMVPFPETRGRWSASREIYCTRCGATRSVDSKNDPLPPCLEAPHD